jgi:hypothetical protein
LTAAASHNGGRTQVNFNQIQFGGDYPFLNVVKACSNWKYQSAPNANAGLDPALLDANGYPTSIQAGGYYGTTYIPHQLSRPGDYVIIWTATGGTSQVRNMGTLISGSYSAAGTSGRAVFTPVSTSLTPGVVSMSSGYVNSIAVVHVDDEAAWLAGDVFGVKFKERLIEGNFGVLRFLNWSQGNLSQVTTWATRKPATYFSYGAMELRSSIYAGQTSNVGNAYSLTIPGGIVHTADNTTWTAGQAPKDKDTLTILFNAAATKSGTCSLDVGSGAINILNQYSDALSVGTNSYPEGSLASNGVATLVYDAVLNGWIKRGGDTADGFCGLNNGCPIEIMLQLSAEVGAHFYITAPHMACTPMTDYHTQIATYLRDNAPSWMVPRFEGPNELWNTLFIPTNYAENVAAAYGWGADYYNWYGRALSTIGQDISAVYSGDTTRYQILCGIRTGAGDTSGNRADHAPRLDSTKYLLQTPQSGYTATAAKNYVTHLCCAQYFGPSDKDTGAETTYAAAYAGATFIGSISGTTLTTSDERGTVAIGMTINAIGSQGSAVAHGTEITGGSSHTWTVNKSQTVASTPMVGGVDLTAPQSYVESCDNGVGNFTLGPLATIYSNWKAWAATFGVNKMCGYEGGLSPDYASSGNSSVDRLRASIKYLPDVYYFEKRNMDSFIAAGGEFPSCYRLSGNLYISGYSTDAWSVLEDVYQSPNPPRFDAICHTNAGKSRLRVRN